MQYKIPVQIENEDPILLNLSIRQLSIIIIFGALAYSIFQGLSVSLGAAVAGIFAIPIGLLGIFIAVFKVAEMSFMQLIFAWLRNKLNGTTRHWVKGVDSFTVLEIGYITSDSKKIDKVDFGDKMDKIKDIDVDEKIKNL